MAGAGLPQEFQHKAHWLCVTCILGPGANLVGLYAAYLSVSTSSTTSHPFIGSFHMKTFKFDYHG